MEQMTIGVIGGSGLYEIEGLTDVKEVRVETPFGDLRAFCAHLAISQGHNSKQVDQLQQWVNTTTQ